MDNYTALSDDSFDDFIVSGNCQEKQNSKDIERLRVQTWKFFLELVVRFLLKYLPEENSFFNKVKV